MSQTVLVNVLLIIGFLAALGLGIWAGVRRYRELERIAHEALAAPNGPDLEMLRRKLGRSSTAVRPFFRLLGFVAGPLLLVGGLTALGVSLWALSANGLHNWWAQNSAFIVLGVGSFPIGVLILRAVITGRDPYLR